MFVANLATYRKPRSTMAAWIFQEARLVGTRSRSGGRWADCEDRGRHSVHHVRLVDWRDDRPLAWRSAPPASSRGLLLPQSPARCVKARSMRPSRSPSATRRATWPRWSPPACRSSGPTATAATFPARQIEASKRALERAEAIVHAELKRGLGGLATIGSTAPFVGLFGTVVGILNAFKEISDPEGHRSGRRRGRHFRSTGDHRHRTVRRDSGRHDVQLLHRPGGSVRRGNGQQLQRADRLFPEAARSPSSLEPPHRPWGFRTRAGLLRHELRVRRRDQSRRRAH